LSNVLCQNAATFNPLMPTVANCHMRTAIKHPVPDLDKPSFVIFYIRALWLLKLSARVPGCQKLQMTALPGRAHCFIAVRIWQQWGSKV